MNKPQKAKQLIDALTEGKETFFRLDLAGEFQEIVRAHSEQEALDKAVKDHAEWDAARDDEFPLDELIDYYKGSLNVMGRATRQDFLKAQAHAGDPSDATMPVPSPDIRTVNDEDRVNKEDIDVPTPTDSEEVQITRFTDLKKGDPIEAYHKGKWQPATFRDIDYNQSYINYHHPDSKVHFTSAPRYIRKRQA